MRVLLLQLDGKLPNIALMRIAAHHRELGDEIDFRWGGTIDSCSPDLLDRPDRVYASLIFEKTRPAAARLLATYPEAIVGGSGWDEKITLSSVGITTHKQDYSIYDVFKAKDGDGNERPKWTQSVGFTLRGCRMNNKTCPFCKVPTMEGDVRPEQTIAEIWRGDPWPRELLLLDNDFFGDKQWCLDRVKEIREGGFKVSFCQGINARFLTEETAALLGGIDCRDDNMKHRCIYTAWDSRKDERTLMRGLELLVKNGFTPRQIMVYVLIGYWPGTGIDDWEYRRAKLREFGCRPYPMPYQRTEETRGFQRWVIGAYDKRISWKDWEANRYRPEGLRLASVAHDDDQPLLGSVATDDD